MSEVERNKGRLIPTGMDTEHFTDDDWDNLYDNGMVSIDGEVYIVEWEVEADECSDYFAEVKENADGSIDFHTMHYNSCHWTEVVEGALNERK